MNASDASDGAVNTGECATIVTKGEGDKVGGDGGVVPIGALCRTPIEESDRDQEEEGRQEKRHVTRGQFYGPRR